MSERKWTESERNEVVRMRNGGYSIETIADYFGRGARSVRTTLVHARRRYNWDNLEPDPMQALRQISLEEATQGLARAIGDNVTDQYVKRRLKELFGIDLSLAEVDAGRERMRRYGVSLQYAFGIKGKAA